MALRAFQANPSIGGFGGESLFERPLDTSQFTSSQCGNDGKHADADRRNRADVVSRTARPLLSRTETDPAKKSAQHFGAGSCDAFAQIVKELVDNAVDACAHAENKNSDRCENADQEEKTMKRVRVTITSAEVPVRPTTNANDEDPGTSVSDSMETMDCLRIEISDNGCGMENIDDCVTAFRSNKNGMAAQGDNHGNSQRTGREAQDSTKTKAKNQLDGGKQRSSQQRIPSDNNENYTSGRYGVGLTLCLLHAQRLCPGTGACITSATASADEWTRATYEPDTGADNIVCKKKENFPKEIEGECGTTISLLVPGGADAQRAWPRLAEYFARFHLSIGLPCSLEVKAPTLHSTPLFVRPSSELERRIHRKRNISHATNTLMDESDANKVSNGRSNKANWEGVDGFDEGNSPVADRNCQEPKTSKAARQRAEAELQKKRKKHLVCKAASAYKGRPLKIENVAITTQPIGRNTSPGQSAAINNGPVLEIGFIVFGSEPDAGDDNDEIEYEVYPKKENNGNHTNDKSSAKLSVVRMVNGIPLLDSSEALACGVVQKISNNAATWNSFGLAVSQNSENDLEMVPSNERNTPTFEINDSAQVAPFLKSTTHSLFQGEQSQDFVESSGGDDDFDMENIGGKRKKVQQVRSILPAHQRLGDVLMVVQIRAKPSALPLPTLSKGRLPLNDKGISDALENGISDCLRCLQISNPKLLLTSHILRGLERSVKYVPAAASAIASVLCRSTHRGVCDNVMSIASGWDDEVKRMGISCSDYGLEKVHRRVRDQPTAAGRSDNFMDTQANEETSRVDALRPILERRLRFVISDEFKDAKRSGEREKQRREREETAAAKRRTKKSKAVEPDGMKSDCFESDGDGSNEHSSKRLERNKTPMKSSHDDFDSDTSSPVVHSWRRHRREGSVGSSHRRRMVLVEQPSVKDFRRDTQKSSHDDFDFDMGNSVGCTRYHNEGGSSISSQLSSVRRGPKRSSFGDSNSEMSTPSKHSGRHSLKQNPPHIGDCQEGTKKNPCDEEGTSISGNHSSVRGSPGGPKKSSCDNLESEISSPVMHTDHRKQYPTDSSQCPRRDITSNQVQRSDLFDSDMNSPVSHTKYCYMEGKAHDQFDDGYESSPSSHMKKPEYDKSPSYLQRPTHRFRRALSNHRIQSDGSRLSTQILNKSALCDDAIDIGYQSSQRLSVGRLEDERDASKNVRRQRSSSSDRFQSDESGLSTHSPDKSARHDDAKSSDSDWSSQYGEVVPGHLSH